MNNKNLYLECYSGISGDMVAAALLDLGADFMELNNGIKSLKFNGFNIEVQRIKKNGINACSFIVRSEPEADRHHPRGLYEINEILDRANISDKARLLARKIYRIIAEAEASVHSLPVDEVHFHEVGSNESIIDIVAAAVCLDNLSINKVIVSALYEGTGLISCSHGVLPVPVPVVTAIAAEYRLPLHITEIAGEMVTPTGAAITAAIRTETVLPKEFRILKSGLGAGKREYPGGSGLLRAMLIEEVH